MSVTKTMYDANVARPEPRNRVTASYEHGNQSDSGSDRTWTGHKIKRQVSEWKVAPKRLENREWITLGVSWGNQSLACQEFSQTGQEYMKMASIAMQHDAVAAGYSLAHTDGPCQRYHHVRKEG